MWKIPLNKPSIGIEEKEAVNEVMKSGMVSSGRMVEEFEERVRKYCGTRNALAVSNCTVGIYMALRNIVDLWDCDVAIPSFTFPAARCCVRHFGSEMGTKEIDVFYDTYNIDTNRLVIVMDSIDAVIPVHQFGLPCEIRTLYRQANEYNVKVIEDAACAMGSEYRGEKIGRHGTAVFSLHGRKIITTGEGGLITTDDDDLYRTLRMERDFGRDMSGMFRGEGLNFKMSDIAAAIGCEQIKKLPEILRERAKVASIYRDILGKCEFVKLPEYIEGTNWQSYVVRLKNEFIRDKARAILGLNGIETQVGSFDNSEGKNEISRELAKKTLALPIWPTMTRHEVSMVAEELIDATKISEV
jgi:dTDP-4-amino-4,6-dideoxygalactose transaminase